MSEPITLRMQRSPIFILHGDRTIGETVREGSDEQIRDPEQYFAGYYAGQEAWAKHFGPLIQEVERGLAELEAFRSQLMKKLEENIVELALAVARKLLHHEIDEGRHRASDMVRGILTSLDVGPDGGTIRIRLHPDDHAEILSLSKERPDDFGEWNYLELVPDESMKRAQFSIDSEFGHVLYDVTQQLDEIEELLVREEGLQ